MNYVLLLADRENYAVAVITPQLYSFNSSYTPVALSVSPWVTELSVCGVTFRHETGMQKPLTLKYFFCHFGFIHVEAIKARNPFFV